MVKIELIILLILQVAQAIFNLYLPDLQADIINEGVIRFNSARITYIGWQMAILIVLQIATAVGAVILAARISSQVAYRVRRDFFHKVQYFNQDQIQKFGVNSLITYATNDVQQLQRTLFGVFLFVVQAPVLIIGGCLLAIKQSARLSLILLIVIPVFLIVAALFFSQLKPVFRALQKRLEDLNRIVRQQILGIRVIRAFVQEKRETQRFEKINNRTYKVLFTAGFLMGVVEPLIWFIINNSSVAAMWFGGKLVESGEMQIGSLEAFVEYLMLMSFGCYMAAIAFVIIPRAAVSSRRLNNVLESHSTIEEVPTPYIPTHPVGEIEFKDVSFSYPQPEESEKKPRSRGLFKKSFSKKRPQEGSQAEGIEAAEQVGVLENVEVQGESEMGIPNTSLPLESQTDVSLTTSHEEQFHNSSSNKSATQSSHLSVTSSKKALSHVSFTIKPHQFTAIVGATGSGKSTILRLLMRQYDSDSGSIAIDGHDIKEYQSSGLISLFGVVPQKSFLFQGTIRSNLYYGNPQASDEELWDALDSAQAKEFVSQTPLGLDAPVDMGGINFSGGQRQRLCIARALLRKGPIYLFDDSLSALDAQTEQKVLKKLISMRYDSTLIMVSQRILSIRQADQILLIDEGKLVAHGTHEELLEKSSLYQQIVISQGVNIEQETSYKSDKENTEESHDIKNVIKDDIKGGDV